MALCVKVPRQTSGGGGSYSAGSGIDITNNVISADSTIARVADLPTIIEKNVTLAAASWSGDAYTITDSDITATATIFLTYPVSTSASDYTALQNAQIRPTAQAAGSISLQALGTVPTSDLTITLVIQEA